MSAGYDRRPSKFVVNALLPHRARRNMAGRTPLQAFIDGLKKGRETSPQKPKGEMQTNKPKQASMQPESHAA